MSTTTVQSVLLACPSCANTHTLSTIERLLGSTKINSIFGGGNALVDIGYDNSGTDIDDDSSETIGVSCDCGWRHEGDDWLDKLVPAKGGRAPGSRIVETIDRGTRTVNGVQVQIYELVWNDHARSFEVYRTSDEKDLTVDGCFDSMPTDAQIEGVLELLEWEPAGTGQDADSIQIPDGFTGARYSLSPTSGGTWELVLIQTLTGMQTSEVALGLFPSEEAAKDAAQAAEEACRARKDKEGSDD